MRRAGGSREERPRVTRRQLETLERIERLIEAGDDGMYPQGAGGWSRMMALKRRGLVRCAGTGQASDNGPEEVVIYELTDAGRDVIARSSRPTPEERSE